MNNYKRVMLGILLGGMLPVTGFAGAVQLQPKLQLQAPALVAGSGLTASLASTSRQTGRLTAASVSWSCRAKVCQSQHAWPADPVKACRALVTKVGPVKSFRDSKHQLSALQIRQCTPVTAKPKPIGQVKVPLASRPIVPQASQHTALPRTGVKFAATGMASTPAGLAATTKRPGTAINPRPLPAGLPGSGFPPSGFADDGRPSNRDAAAAIREAAASRASQARITSVSPLQAGYACVKDVGGSPAQFVIQGSRFGAAAAGRTIQLATRIRHTPVATARIISWSDNRIVAELPYHDRDIHHPQRYEVGFQDNRRRWVSNLNRELAVCPNTIEVTGQVRLDSCDASLRNVKIGVKLDGRTQRDLSVSAVPGNDFAMQYRLVTPAVPSTTVELTPKLEGISCPGGSWNPVNQVLRLGFNHYRATQDFNYHVGLLTFRIGMDVLSGMMRTAFNGTRIRLNNYNPATHRKVEWDSSIHLSDALGGGEQSLNILPVKTGPRTYYINDINLAGIGVRPAGNELKVSLNFETRGTEFIGTCFNDLGCIAGAPDVQANISVDVFLTLERYYSRGAPLSISYGRVRVVANPSAQADGVCLAIDALCEAFTHYKQQIKQAIEVNLYHQLNTANVRDQVANALRSTLGALHIGRVNSAGVEGSSFIIRYLPTE